MLRLGIIFCLLDVPFLVCVGLLVIVDVVAEDGCSFLGVSASQVYTAACGFVDDGDCAVLLDELPLLIGVILVEVTECEPLSVCGF